MGSHRMRDLHVPMLLPRLPVEMEKTSPVMKKMDEEMLLPVEMSSPESMVLAIVLGLLVYIFVWSQKICG
ncbi:hypothetical protein ACLOJK_004388 [Asimina triloba]